MKTVVVGGARTAFGRFGGGLRSFRAAELGGVAIKGALLRAGVKPEDIDQVIMGTVLQAGQGQLPSRQAAREAGIPWEVKTETINKVCASGLRAVSLADQIIRAGDEEVIVAGGMESMSNAPYAMKHARWGTKMGNVPLVDLLLHDGLTCAFTGTHMGMYGNAMAKKYEITREEQDEWALRSNQLVVKAIEGGFLAEEIVPVVGNKETITVDESPRKDTTIEKLANLKPAFGETITAGNAPGINDGAAAFVLMSDKRAQQSGHLPIASIIGHAEVAVQAEEFPLTPALAIQKLLQKTGKRIEDIDLFEINEAFAAVALTSIHLLNLDRNKVNVNGGAVALGHPIGASGARILLTLMYELRRRGGGLGIATICSGGGQGDAILIEVPQ
nr:acetyl-CoA C-acetyltransferase [Paenibacillus bovis]